MTGLSKLVPRLYHNQVDRNAESVDIPGSWWQRHTETDVVFVCPNNHWSMFPAWCVDEKGAVTFSGGPRLKCPEESCPFDVRVTLLDWGGAEPPPRTEK